MRRPAKKRGSNPRERVLAIALIVVLAGWFLWPRIKAMLITPIEDRRAEVATLEQRIETKELEELRTIADERQTRIWEALSLPPDPLDAQRAYLEWVIDLVAEAGFETSQVTTTPPVSYGDVYSTIAVDVTGTATFDAVSRLLFHARRTNLMHRIARLELTATGRSSSSPLEVHLVAEGFAMKSAPPRSTIFPKVRLAEPLGTDTDVLVVDATEGFPKSPGFEIRLDDERARVTSVDGTSWTVERGLHWTRASRHDADAVVQLVPVDPKWRDETIESFEEFLKNNPFAEPRRYTPSVSPIRDVTISRGETARAQVRASGYDPNLGQPKFTLADGFEPGMSLDPESGAFTWTPPEDAIAGAYEVILYAEVPGLAQPLERSFDVVIRDPNASPRLSSIGPQSVSQGGELRFVAEASDPDEGQKLSFDLRNAPRGASIDEETGEFVWSVPVDFESGTTRIEVRVEDERRASDSISVEVAVRENTARSTFLVGTIDRGEEREAWLIERNSGEKFVLYEGIPARLAGVPTFVLVIGRDFILLEQDETTYRLDLGHSLEDLEEQLLETEISTE